MVQKKQVDPEMTASINLMENAVYAVKDGRITQIPKPSDGYGTTQINWQGGKPCHGKMEHNFKL